VVHGATAGQLAVSLPWLAPSAAALAALTDDPPAVAPLAADIGAIAHIYRFARPTLRPGDDPFNQAVLQQPALCSAAAELIAQQPTGPTPTGERLRRAADLAARVAARLADGVPPAVAAAVTRLAFLGCRTVETVDPSSAVTDAGSINRRLAARWRLPEWLTATLGSLHLHADDAIRLGATDGLFQVVQAAVSAAERILGSFGITPPDLPGDDELAGEVAESLEPVPTPPTDPGLPNAAWAKLLRATAAARRAGGAAWLSEAEDRYDRATEALQRLRADQAVALRDAKLASLAEFAAGASHEINNPLAVIAGHAQMLIAGEDDPDRRKQFAAILRQTTRVHDLLHGMLQFARPSRPTPDRFDLCPWLHDAVEAVRPDAERKQVTLKVGLVDAATLRADTGQARQALTQLLLNAIQAATVGGWVRVSAVTVGGRATVAVEDDGPGPDANHLPHLFDPFFSGRSAGRGRGLGLSIAWRLARVNGGSVEFKPFPGRPTRFTLSLPAVPDAPPQCERRSA
jgi:signal transduction histidine kinase